MSDFNSMWFCPKDKTKLHEKTLRNQGGKFPINISQPEFGINNALAVRKISENQRAEALELIQELAQQFPDKKTLTLVSVECPICGFRAITPELSTLGALTTSKAVRKGQVKTIQSITRQAEVAAKKSSAGQGNRPNIFLLMILFGAVASLLGVAIVYLLQYLP
ncbi:MAG: hypothetical protein ACXACI_02005 [Candidatus Hodarchaeales archaeon]